MNPIPLLHDLVACNSINPSLVPGAPGEGEVAEVAARALRAAGLDVVRQEAAPGRPNVIGVLEGRQPGPAVMFCGHLDTVGVDGMTDPFVPRIEGDRLYGRGAQDMKGGVAAMIAAANALAGSWSRGRLIVACVVDEEHMSLGAEALVREWRADFAVVTEPTDLRLAIGHKGFAWLDITTTGRAAHGSRPEEGRDAIARMGRVLVALEARDRELRARPSAPFQGTGSLHASIIRGGAELSSYPAACALQMERRTVAGETGESVLEETNAMLDALRRDDPEFVAAAALVAYRPAYALDAGHQLVNVFRRLLDDGRRTSEPTGMSFWTDAAILAEAGIPAVLFGPGGAGLHSREEYVLMDDVRACALALAVAARRLVG
jgi:acetylornithine deacetylase/succinyl-diaminopimelate desuccinylase-like protein